MIDFWTFFFCFIIEFFFFFFWVKNWKHYHVMEWQCPKCKRYTVEMVRHLLIGANQQKRKIGTDPTTTTDVFFLLCSNKKAQVKHTRHDVLTMMTMTSDTRYLLLEKVSDDKKWPDRTGKQLEEFELTVATGEVEIQLTPLVPELPVERRDTQRFRATCSRVRPFQLPPHSSLSFFLPTPSATLPHVWIRLAGRNDVAKQTMMRDVLFD